VDAALGVALAAGLVAVAFIATGGLDLATNTWTEIVLMVVGAAVAIVAIARGAPGRAWGAVTLALFAAFVALTAVSIAWSVQPDQSWIATNQIVAYLAVFGGSIALARLFPERWSAVLGGIAVTATAVSGYALLVKVFPATFNASDNVGRLGAPFDYWNATGLIAALGLPPCLWGGARRERARALRALAPPAIAILGTVVVLSYSRGALLAAVIGLACWFIAVPLRLRGALVLALGLAGAVALSVFALHTHGLTHNEQSLASRTAAGHAFGIVLVLVLLVTTAAGFVAAFAMDRMPPAPAVRRRVAIALLVLVALIPVAGVGGLAASSRGLTGEVSHVWSTLTNPNSGAANAPSRLVELGNARGRYWSEGLKVGEHALLKGVGALGYATAVTRYTTDTRVVPHAHSFVIQTFADFGLIGIAVVLALLIAWSVAAVRSLMPTGERRHDAERAGLLTLLAVVVTFGVHSSVDWTWFVPGTALPALICAGWLAGRGPLGGAAASAAPARPRGSLAIGATALAITAVALILAWVMYQPLRSANANDAAIQAFAAGDSQAALAKARSAASIDPLSVDPLWEAATIDQATGQLSAARTELLRAVDRQPENPLTWLQLGQLDLAAHQPASAVAGLRRAQQLDLGSQEIAQTLAQAEAALSRGG
jgi:hypothetical protein